MERKVITPEEFGQMLGISAKTAARHMAAQDEHLNVGTKGQRYLRLPLSVALEIASGKRPLNPVEETLVERNRPAYKKNQNRLFARQEDGLRKVAYKK